MVEHLLRNSGSIVNALAMVGVDGAADLVRPAAGHARDPRAAAGSRRGAAAQLGASAAPAAAGAAAAGGIAGEAQPNLIADLTSKLGRTPQKRLEQMIDFDEEQAAAILKQWMHGAQRAHERDARRPPT